MKASGTFRAAALFAAILVFAIVSAGRLQAQEPAKPQFVFPALPESLNSGNPLVLKVESKQPDDGRSLLSMPNVVIPGYLGQ